MYRNSCYYTAFIDCFVPINLIYVGPVPIYYAAVRLDLRPLSLKLTNGYTLANISTNTSNYVFFAFLLEACKPTKRTDRRTEGQDP